MEPFAWPIAVVVIAFGFMLIFKKQIAVFLSRVREVGRSGIKAADQEPQPPTEAATPTASDLRSAPPNPLIAQREAEISTDLTSKGIADSPDAVRLLARQLAIAQVSLGFEFLDNVIWGSQVDLIRFLNGSPTGVYLQGLRPFYDSAAIKYPDAYKNYPFESYKNFLVDSVLMVEQNGRYLITAFAREYLVYLTTMGRTGFRHF